MKEGAVNIFFAFKYTSKCTIDVTAAKFIVRVVSAL